ncbi:MAG: amidohydrolase family protein [Planctomycetales bacterium]|nr:amidohydrolase family protein [Planctomycetales bacterium]
MRYSILLVLGVVLQLLLHANQLLGQPPSHAAGQTTAFVGARVIPIEGSEIAKGTILVSGTKIVAVGAVDEVDVPGDAQRVDCVGRVIMPGLICTHSHIGGSFAADGSHPVQPGVRVLDSINVHDSGFKRALAGGLTTLNIMPGSGHLSSGQTIYVKLRYHGDSPSTVDDILIRDASGNYLGGLKMANGTNSMRDAPFPGTRGKSAFLMRQEFIKAREYHDKIVNAAGDAKKMPARDLHLESLVEVLQGQRVVHHHTHRHDDIMTVIRLSREFQFRVVLHHVSEGWKVADEIAAANVPCSMIMIDSPGGKLEARYLSMETGKILEQAGVRTAFHTDDPILDSRYFFRSAALAVRAGMSRQAALEGLTLAGAQMLDLQDRVGSIKPGKDADLVILDADPLSVYAKVLETWVEGQRTFDRSDAQDRLYAEGGYGASHDRQSYYCCFDQANQGGSQ